MDKPFVNHCCFSIKQPEPGNTDEMTNNYSQLNASKLIIILTIIPQIRGRPNINKTNFG